MRNNNFLPKETVLRIIDSPRTKEQMVDMIKGIPEVEAIEIKEGATIGDMMVGMFPNLKVEDNGGAIYLHYPDGGWIAFDRDWWYSPYKR